MFPHYIYPHTNHNLAVRWGFRELPAAGPTLQFSICFYLNQQLSKPCVIFAFAGVSFTSLAVLAYLSAAKGTSVAVYATEWGETVIETIRHFRVCRRTPYGTPGTRNCWATTPSSRVMKGSTRLR